MATVRRVPCAILLFVGCCALLPAVPAAASIPRTSLAETQVAADVAALNRNPTAREGRPFLQGYDAAMDIALLSAADRFGDSGPKTGRSLLSPGAVHIVRPGVARVALNLISTGMRPPGGYLAKFKGEALRLNGRWKLSWSTLCLLAETGGQVCPRTPKGISPGPLLPEQVDSLNKPADLTPGLIDPGPLAIAPDGGVLIADQGRDQILEWKNGALRVVAGDGLVGFSGDGGPAVDAELNYPGEIAVQGGTIYFVDQANDRIRAISLNGTITTVAGDGRMPEGASGDSGEVGMAVHVPLNPYGLAVGPSGILFISSGSSILEVGPNGIVSTDVRGGPPYGADVMVDGVPTAFFPGTLALDGQGDLIVFGTSPKLLFSVTPGGQVTQLAQFYATALSTAPDGSVLAAAYGTSMSRVNGKAVSTLLNFETVPVPGLDLPLSPEGVAEAPDGTIYADTKPGDGYNDQTSLVAITDGTARAVPITTAVTSTLPQLGASGFRAATYPLTRTPSDDLSLRTCPSSAGLVPFTQAATKEARTLLGFWNTSFSYDLHASDRSAWLSDVTTFISGPFGGRLSIESIGPARRSLYASAVEAACGAKLVQHSLAVTMGPSSDSSAVEHLFVLDRDGTPLVYFSAL
jgi:hypothetical protein